MTKNDIIAYLKEHKDDLMQKYQISRIALFGSYSRDENRVDNDIAIETPLSDYFLLYNLKEELENRFHTKVDIVLLREQMNMALKRRIQKDGIYV